MKTLKQLAFFLLLGSASILTSCKDDEPVAPENKPTITVTADKKTAAPGETVKLTIQVGAEKAIKTVNVKVSAGGGTAGTILDSTYASGRNTSTITYDYLVGSSANYAFTATVTDRDGVTATGTETITVSGTGATDINLCSGIRLGAQSSTTGSSFSSSNCSVYTVNQAKSNASNVDFLYFYGASNEATLAAPNDEAADDFTTFDLANWSTRNATKMMKLSGFDFNAATSASITSAVASASATKVNKLAVGDVVGFMTAGGKSGVARVKSISGGGSGSIVLDVKTTK